MTYNYTHLSENVSRSSVQALEFIPKNLTTIQKITNKVTDPATIPLLFFIMFACVLFFGFLAWLKFRKTPADF